MRRHAMAISMTVIALGIILYVRFFLNIPFLDVLDEHLCFVGC